MINVEPLFLIRQTVRLAVCIYIPRRYEYNKYYCYYFPQIDLAIKQIEYIEYPMFVEHLKIAMSSKNKRTGVITSLQK